MGKIRFKKGDLITYSNGLKKFINNPFKYEKYFDNNYYNETFRLQIIKVQRYKKILCFSILYTAYKKYGVNNEKIKKFNN